jgi:hypothetical protein
MQCGDLVDWQWARRAARKSGRRLPSKSMGCYHCGPHHRPTRRRSQQIKMATELLGGKRTLIVRPTDSAQPEETKTQTSSNTTAVARHVLRQHGAEHV